MKAKDYIAAIRAAREAGTDEREIAAKLFRDLGQEGYALGQARGKGKREIPDTMARAILKELDLKYRAIAHAVDYNPNGWRDIWADKKVTW